MGVKEISINSVKCFAQNNVTDAKTADDGDNYVMFVYGENFTPYSTIYVNGEELNTMFVSDNVISATCSMPAHNDMITVAQVGEDGNILSETDGFVVTKEVLLNMLQDRTLMSAIRITMMPSQQLFLQLLLQLLLRLCLQANHKTDSQIIKSRQ